MPTETTPEEAAYAAACLPDRLRSAACLDRVHFDVPTDEEEIVSVLHEAADKLEAADALLSLSAAYREAYAACKEAQDEADAAFSGPKGFWDRAANHLKSAQSVMDAARDALLSAALDIR